MKIKLLNQKGFGALEVLLLIVIIGIIGGAGWYVYQSQKKTNESLDKANQNIETIAQNKQKTEKSDETTSWKEFTFQKGYKVKLPDGWSLLHSKEGHETLLIFDPANMVFKQGNTATIKELTEGGRDGGVSFSFVVPYDFSYAFSQSSSYKDHGAVNGGDFTVKKYSYEQTTEPEGPGLQKGDKMYAYRISLDGKTVGQVTHVYNTQAQDQSVYIEKMLGTLKKH